MSESFLKSNYYNRLKSFVKNKIAEIDTEKSKLDNEIAQLNAEKQSKTDFLQETERQSQLLLNEQDKHRVMIASLKEDESSLKDLLSEQKVQREEMNIAIEKIIRSEFDDGSTINAPNEVSGIGAVLPDYLSWPVSGGVITSRYGKQRHPTLRNVTISNNGVDIRAPKGSAVTCVDSGSVVSVSEVAGFGKMIILDHSGYYTVYSKLGTVQVTKGQSLQKGSVLGNLNTENNLSELHFEIWKDNKTLNPEKWLRK